MVAKTGGKEGVVAQMKSEEASSGHLHYSTHGAMCMCMSQLDKLYMHAQAMSI